MLTSGQALSTSTPDEEQPSISLSPPQAQDLECEEEEEEDGIPEHEFEIKTTEGKTGKMKGVSRVKVSLVIGNHIFRKRKIEKNGLVQFSCNGCETRVPRKYLSANARIKEDGTYELVEWPRMITPAGQMGPRL